MKNKTYTCILALLATCAISNGAINPGSHGLAVGPKGQIFTYLPPITQTKSGMVEGEQAKVDDWGVTGKPFSGAGIPGNAQQFKVTVDVTKLDKDDAFANSGTVTCKKDSVRIQGVSVD